MPTDNPHTQSQKAAARVNERIEQGAQRVEQQVQSATEAAIRQVRDARERAESGLEQQRAMVAERVRRVSEALRHTSDQLSRQDQFAQNLLDSASERVQRVATYIENAQLEDVAQDVHSFARRQPAYFFGGAFLVGLALGRFAKSSASSIASNPAPDELEPRRRALPRAESTPRREGAEGAQPVEGMPRTEGLPRTESTQRTEPAQRTETSQRTETAQRAPGYDVSSGGGTRTAPATSTAVGSAFGTDVKHSATTASDPPKPQPTSASTQARSTEPGQGNKS